MVKCYFCKEHTTDLGLFVMDNKLANIWLNILFLNQTLHQHLILQILYTCFKVDE